YRVALGLAQMSRPFSMRRYEKFMASAAKRDPQRWALRSQLQGRSGLPPADEGFVPYGPPAPITPAVRLLAYYLPQYHPFPENDAWWGKGFTEWTNVGKARPLFPGHHQPHCPIHFGYYDLRIPSVMEEQARVAREYGIGGFSFYFYWFAGKVLMHEPMEAMLANPKVDIPFCLTWANENWTRRWDGREDDVLIAQEHSLADSRAFLHHVARYFRDPRYIRIDGKPVLLVYRVEIIPEIRQMAEMWRDEMRALGFDGIYLIAVQAGAVSDPRPYGFDAAAEFPPNGLRPAPITDRVAISDPDFRGKVIDYVDARDTALTRPEPDYRLIRGAMLSWDNTARRQHTPTIFHNFSCTAFRDWLIPLIRREVEAPDRTPDERIVLINAWNEWAEGSHLEPDQKHGFGYLQAVRDALLQVPGATQSEKPSAAASASRPEQQPDAD
ncbi:MAG: glycoside hydrolase family 99-like domain-containing protein, partial [Rhodobacterales bacterium]|nr:glycoside hydrolase family 99-like domain-containing protein [Rhodobacterales bacterium]